MILIDFSNTKTEKVTKSKSIGQRKELWMESQKCFTEEKNRRLKKAS